MNVQPVQKINFYCCICAMCMQPVHHAYFKMLSFCDPR